MKSRRIFSKPGNKKGSWCPFKPILCQEGYCHECQVYRDWQRKNGNSTSPRTMESKGREQK